jgi:hypothetical protein
MLADLADGPTLCTYEGEGKAGETDDETLNYRASDSIQGFPLKPFTGQKVLRSQC